MTREEQLACLEDRPCSVCKFHTDRCNRWTCVFEDEPEDQEPCEDAISRQMVLDGVASIAKAKARSDEQKALMGRVMFFTEHLPPVNPQEPKWILVSERLPNEKLEDYLACCSDGYISTIMYDGCNGRWLIDDAEVVAWMPLPEPYKAEGSGEE